MADLSLKSGRCLCGAVTFTAKAGHEMHACHCDYCRRWSGGAFMSVFVEGVEIADESQIGVYKSSDYGERVFCKTCGSSLFWRMQDGSAAVASLQAFEDKSGVAFAEEIYIDKKPALYSFAGSAATLTEAEFLARMTGQESSGG